MTDNTEARRKAKDRVALLTAHGNRILRAKRPKVKVTIEVKTRGGRQAVKLADGASTGSKKPK